MARPYPSADKIDRASPIRHAEAAFKQAEEYTQKIINRVNYLQHEEDMMKRKINKKVSEVEKLYQLREDKITSLKEKLKHETSQERNLKKRADYGRNTRETNEMSRMQRAYFDMMQFENDKKRAREEKEELR